MSDTSQMRALKNYRHRLKQRGLARFEVLGLAADRELIRSMARNLADNGPEAAELRASMHRRIADESAKRGGIVAALRRSPLVGAGLILDRPRIDGRKVDL